MPARRRWCQERHVGADVSRAHVSWAQGQDWEATMKPLTIVGIVTRHLAQPLRALMASSIWFGLKPVSFFSPMSSTGSDVSPMFISSCRACGSFPTFFSVNAMPFCDRYSTARWQGPHPMFV